MARTPNALVHALDGVMENSALAMEEQRNGLRLLAFARRHARHVRRTAAADGVIDTREAALIREARHLVRGCEGVLALDVRDEELCRETAGELETYVIETSRHKRHEAATERPRTQSARA